VNEEVISELDLERSNMEEYEDQVSQAITNYEAQISGLLELSKE
jgi:hypothetical protein